MNRGFITSANTKTEQKAAATLANSIKIHNPNASVTLVIDKLVNIDSKFEAAFDYIVELPNKSAKELRANDWQLYYTSPYDNSIFIHHSTIVCQNLDSAFDFFEHSYNVCFLTSESRFNYDTITKLDGYYEDNNLLKPSTTMFYFNKSDASLEYFKIAEPIMQNWQQSQTEILTNKKHIKKYYDPSQMHSIVINCFQQPNDYLITNHQPVTVIDMTYETYSQRSIANSGSNDWVNYLNCWIYPNYKVKIQNFNINSIFYYDNINFLTDEIYATYNKEI